MCRGAAESIDAIEGDRRRIGARHAPMIASSAVSGERGWRPLAESTAHGSAATWRWLLGVGPAELRRRSARRRRRPRGSRRRGRAAAPGAPREHVVERARHLVAHRVHRLGSQVGQARHERLAERGSPSASDATASRLAAVAVGEVRVEPRRVAESRRTRRRRGAISVLGASCAAAGRRAARRPRRRCRPPSSGRW